MSGFARNAAGVACLSGTPLTELLAQARATTPAYLYDLDAVFETASSLVQALGDERHVVAYAIKANSAGSVVQAAARAGTGADVVSGAELEVATGSGIAPDRIVMSGVGKTDVELDLAIASRILAIQAESVEEIGRIAARARALAKPARVALRVKPGVEADTHAHVATGHDAAKFGIAVEDIPHAWTAIDAAGDHLQAVGISTHVGSNLATPEPYRASARAVCEVAQARLSSGRSLEYVDFGGGFGIDYGGRPVQPLQNFIQAALDEMRQAGLDDLRLVVEPGRSIVGAHGVLVARVVQAKVSGDRRWVVIDAGMNDLLRPALYQARHRIERVDAPASAGEWRVVGPICESADDFGSHALGDAPPALVVIRDAGAYGFAMASQYNGRPLPTEIFVSQAEVASVSHSAGPKNWVRNRLSA